MGEPGAVQQRQQEQRVRDQHDGAARSSNTELSHDHHRAEDIRRRAIITVRHAAGPFGGVRRRERRICFCTACQQQRYSSDGKKKNVKINSVLHFERTYKRRPIPQGCQRRLRRRTIRGRGCARYHVNSRRLKRDDRNYPHEIINNTNRKNLISVIFNVRKQ